MAAAQPPARGTATTRRCAGRRGDFRCSPPGGRRVAPASSPTPRTGCACGRARPARRALRGRDVADRTAGGRGGRPLSGTRPSASAHRADRFWCAGSAWHTSARNSDRRPTPRGRATPSVARPTRSPYSLQAGSSPRPTPQHRGEALAARDDPAFGDGPVLITQAELTLALVQIQSYHI